MSESPRDKAAEAAKGTNVPKEAAIPPERYERLRKFLVTKRDEILAEAKAEIANVLGDKNRQSLEAGLDDGDWSVLDQLDNLRYRKLASHQNQLRKVQNALNKLENQTYGICEECEEEIPAARLEVLPFASKCRDCQEEEEDWQSSTKGDNLDFGS